MIEILNDKAIETIVAVAISAVSFLAGQGWSLGKTLYRERKLKKALQREIAEMPPWLLRNLRTLECMIQLARLHELANYGPVPIPVQVHAEHFPEINLKLSTSERTSIGAIYQLVHRINADCSKITDLNPTCRTDADNFYQLMLLLDTSFRNSHQALLLIRLHLANINNLDEITTSNKTDEMIYALRAQNDEELVKLAAEARKDGAAAIRKKYQDGAVSVEEFALSPPPVPDCFYFDSTGTKYKCLNVKDGNVTLMQLESQVGMLTVDAIVLRPLDSIRGFYEITDPDEKARLERRCQQLRGQVNPQSP